MPDKTITRMVACAHQHKDKVYAAGEKVTATPAQIHVMDNMGVLVPKNKEQDFIAALELHNGDAAKALAEIVPTGGDGTKITGRNYGAAEPPSGLESGAPHE